MDKKLPKNAFHEMEDEHINRHFLDGRSERIKSNLDGDLGRARRLGNISDVYIKRFADVVMGMFGANEDRFSDQQRGERNEKNRSKYPNENG